MQTLSFTLHYHVTHTADFLEKLLPIEKVTVETLEVKDRQSRRLTDFPTPTDLLSRVGKSMVPLRGNPPSRRTSKEKDQDGSYMGVPLTFAEIPR